MIEPSVYQERILGILTLTFRPIARICCLLTKVRGIPRSDLWEIKTMDAEDRLWLSGSFMALDDYVMMVMLCFDLKFSNFLYF